jgi:hypothetical protein
MFQDGETDGVIVHNQHLHSHRKLVERIHSAQTSTADTAAAVDVSLSAAAVHYRVIITTRSMMIWLMWLLMIRRLLLMMLLMLEAS